MTIFQIAALIGVPMASLLSIALLLDAVLKSDEREMRR